MAIFANGLLPASFRGAPFAVNASEVGGGRRIALHQYPGRDDPWAEDMGRAPRTFRFRAFIVDGDVAFAGGPIQLQRTLLLAALERRGPGALVHPTLGLITASVTRFSIGEDLGAGRFSSVDLELVESGRRMLPGLLSTSSGLFTAANLCIAGLVVDAVRALSLVRRADRAAVRDAVQAWSAEVEAYGDDATSLQRLTAQLPGSYGRFAAGANVGLAGRRSGAITDTTSVADLVRIASARRVAVADAASRAKAEARALKRTDLAPLPTTIAAMVQALADACADPRDAIRLLARLIERQFGASWSSIAAGIAVTKMIQRAAAAALVTVVAGYQPGSADDAAALIGLVGALLERAATEAADAGDDASFRAIRDARSAIVRDLRGRGAGLAQIAPVRSARPTPWLAVAQRLYQDADRAEQLLGQVDVPSPLFLPTYFEALAA